MRRALIICALLAANVATAQSIDEGRRAYLEADFETAISTFEAVLQRPSLTREEAADAHRYLTTLRSLQGQTEAAQRHAVFAVTLDPSADAPQGSPEEVSALLAAALESTGGQPARLTIESDEPLRSGERASIRARFSPSPEGLVELIELRCAAGGAPVSQEGPPPEVELTLEPGADARCRANALTAARAALASVRATLELERPSTVAVTGEERRETRGGEEPSERKVWPWILVAVAVVAAAVAIPLIIVRPFAADDPQLGTTRIEGW